MNIELVVVYVRDAVGNTVHKELVTYIAMVKSTPPLDEMRTPGGADVQLSFRQQ